MIDEKLLNELIYEFSELLTKMKNLLDRLARLVN